MDRKTLEDSYKIKIGLIMSWDAVMLVTTPHSSWLYSLYGGHHCFSTNTEAAPRSSPVSAVGADMSCEWVLGGRHAGHV